MKRGKLGFWGWRGHWLCPPLNRYPCVSSKVDEGGESTMRIKLTAMSVTMLLSLAASGARADCVTGTINTVNAMEGAGIVIFQMAGRLTLQGTCPAPAQWFGQFFTDNNFRQFIYPVMLIAKASQDTITICTNGCISSTYPQIDTVEYSPRLP